MKRDLEDLEIDIKRGVVPGRRYDDAAKKVKWWKTVWGRAASRKAIESKNLEEKCGTRKAA